MRPAAIAVVALLTACSGAPPRATTVAAPSSRANTGRSTAHSTAQTPAALLARATQDVRITAMVSPDLPVPHESVRDPLRTLLSELAALPNVEVELLEPALDDPTPEGLGISPIAIQVVGEDEVLVHTVYKHLAIEVGGSAPYTAMLPFGDELTPWLALTLREAGVVPRARVGVWIGSGTAGLDTLTRLAAGLPAHELVPVAATAPIPDWLSVLLLVRPKSEIPADARERIADWVEAGGGLALFAPSFVLDAGGEPLLTPVETGASELVRRWGISVGSGLVLARQCARVPLQSESGLTVVVPHPPVPVVTVEPGSHPVAADVESLAVPIASPITGAAEQRNAFTVAITDDAWSLPAAESIDVSPRPNHEWVQGDPVEAVLVLAAEVGRGRIVVAGSALVTDTFMPESRGSTPLSSFVFARNALFWLARDDWALGELVRLRREHD